MRKLIAIALVLASAIALTACGDDYATSTSDSHVCVFDGSERGGQKLKFQIAPGAESKEIDDNDQVVTIPASNRFWMVSPNRQVADPGTPEFYTGNAQGGVPTLIEGQIEFRFNLDLACEWYSKHGRRNANAEGDLGFNVRGDANQGWFLFLNQYFTLTMQEVVGEQLSSYEWASLHYNYPENADAAGLVPDGEEPGTPVRLALGEDLGNAFTERLRTRLGGDYFCGVVTTDEEPCSPLTFQVVYAGPGSDSTLVQDRQRVEDTKQQLESARLEGELQATQQEAIVAAEKAEQIILAERLNTARIEAQIGAAQCAEYAKFGLDCEGKHPTYVVPGS